MDSNGKPGAKDEDLTLPRAWSSWQKFAYFDEQKTERRQKGVKVEE
jgi:hypothetical protein